MSIVICPQTGDPIHTPKRKELFEFDAEVAQIFDNMAVRSIPLYHRVHEIHATIAARRNVPPGGIKVLDIGASTGAFFQAYCNQLHKQGVDLPSVYSDIECIAVDTSATMLDKIKEEMPWVSTLQTSCTDMFDIDSGSIDIANMTYVLQFIKDKRIAVAELARVMKPDGLVFMAQKDYIVGTSIRDEFMEQYYQFRRDNGYTEQEIKTKTEALRGSMFIQSWHELCIMLLECGFGPVQETTRWLEFSSLMTYRRSDL